MKLAEVLISLGLNYAHILVRRKTAFGIEYLGGGTVSVVISRFGECIIVNSVIQENMLVIYVL